MKKVNKLLLMGAALSGALVTKAGAYVDMDLNGQKGLATLLEDAKTKNNLSNHVNQQVQNLQNLIKRKGDLLDVSSLNRNWAIQEDCAIVSGITDALAKIAGTQLVSKVLEKLNDKTHKKLTINYFDTLMPSTGGGTGMTPMSADTINIYGLELRNSVANGITMQGFPYRPKYVSDLYFINELKNNIVQNNSQVSKLSPLISNAFETTAHELGHVVHNVLATLRAESLGYDCMTDGDVPGTQKINIDVTDRDTWLGQFYAKYESELKNRAKNTKWEKFKPSAYSTTSLHDRFADDFAKAVVKGKDLGDSEESKIFEEVLTESANELLKTSMTECLAPSP